jgi:glutamate dehydrogenase
MTDRIRALQKELQDALSTRDAALYRKIQRTLGAHLQIASENLDWLYANMHPYFFITMKEEIEAIVNLAGALHNIANQKKITLIDEEEDLIVARLDLPGSLYDTLKTLREREISYAEMTHSYGPLPGAKKELEIQKFEFERISNAVIACAGKAKIPKGTRKSVAAEMKRLYHVFDPDELDKVLDLLWHNNQTYVRISPPERVARILWLYIQAKRHDGLYLDVEKAEQVSRYRESRILFSVGNPEQRGFLAQVSEVFQRLNIGVRRSYCVNINTGVHPYFLGTFYVTPRDGKFIEKDSDFFKTLKAELYNTQILSTDRSTYTNFVANRIMTGEEASLTNAFIAFCHTTLAHNQPDRYGLEAAKSAFQSDADFTLKLIHVFRSRFDPVVKNRQESYKKAMSEIEQSIESYNTGHRYLDDIRKTIFRACLLLIRYTLKTNFFVPEKHALAFRLDPAYLDELGVEFTSDLPQKAPFRVTFFFSRYGLGYHIGFSDIARGGWRTIISKTQDEYTTNTNTLFREVFVLAHTQHLKNKDIYEGGSKLTVVLDAEDCDSPESVTQRLYKVQYGINNAFLDIFVTENGHVKNPQVVDYYGEDEPIEQGPDENMHDSMIEHIALQSVKRGYILGIGIMSSKRVGINHKEYGVTSRGVVKFAEIAMKEIGIDIYKDAFSVKFTGGTNGDVAGNSIRLLLSRCPRSQIRSIVDGTAGLFDPDGADRNELGKLVLKNDLDHFRPEALHPRGFMLFWQECRKDGLRELHRKVIRTDSGVE